MQQRQTVPRVLGVLYDSKHVLTRPVVLRPVVALAVWHIRAVAETHEILGVPFLTVENKSTAVELVDTAVAVQCGGRAVATDVQEEISWMISQEIWQVRVVLAVGVRVLYAQLHIPVNSVNVHFNHMIVTTGVIYIYVYTCGNCTELKCF